MLRISVVDIVDGQEAGRKNYPSPVSLMVCGEHEVLFTYVDALGCLNTVRVSLMTHEIQLYEC